MPPRRETGSVARHTACVSRGVRRMVALVLAVCLLEAAGLGAVLSIDLTAERVEAHTADLAAQAVSKSWWSECMPLQQVSVDVRRCGHQ